MLRKFIKKAFVVIMAVAIIVPALPMSVLAGILQQADGVSQRETWVREDGVRFEKHSMEWGTSLEIHFPSGATFGTGAPLGETVDIQLINMSLDFNGGHAPLDTQTQAWLQGGSMPTQSQINQNTQNNQQPTLAQQYEVVEL